MTTANAEGFDFEAGDIKGWVTPNPYDVANKHAARRAHEVTHADDYSICYLCKISWVTLPWFMQQAQQQQLSDASTRKLYVTIPKPKPGDNNYDNGAHDKR